ncbi:hypothetical protein AB4Y42_41800 [Paraburkholderia sp. EG286B]
MKTNRYRNLQSRAFGADPLNCLLCGIPLRYIGITRGKSLAQLRPHPRGAGARKNCCLTAQRAQSVLRPGKWHV